MAEALEPAAKLLGVLGIRETEATLTDRIVGESQDRLRAGFRSSPATMLADLDGWPTTRAEQVVASILGDNGHVN